MSTAQVAGAVQAGGAVAALDRGAHRRVDAARVQAALRSDVGARHWRKGRQCRFGNYEIYGVKYDGRDRPPTSEHVNAPGVKNLKECRKL